MTAIVLPINTAVEVTDASTDVVTITGDQLPKTVFLTNDSTDIIYVSIWDNPGVDAELNSGIRLNASGGAFALDVSNLEQNKNMYINAISDGVSSNLCVSILN